VGFRDACLLPGVCLEVDERHVVSPHRCLLKVI
jgi:hypothetical protein